MSNFKVASLTAWSLSPLMLQVGDGVGNFNGVFLDGLGRKFEGGSLGDLAFVAVMLEPGDAVGNFKVAFLRTRPFPSPMLEVGGGIGSCRVTCFLNWPCSAPQC